MDEMQQATKELGEPSFDDIFVSAYSTRLAEFDRRSQRISNGRIIHRARVAGERHTKNVQCKRVLRCLRHKDEARMSDHAYHCWRKGMGMQEETVSLNAVKSVCILYMGQ